MPEPPGGIRGSPRFRTTHWSLVVAAGRSSSPRSREALSELCESYWYPIYAFARRSGIEPADAQDLTQGFFAHLLERESLKHADRDRGRFRSFLLASFRNFTSDERDRQNAKKRGGGQAVVPIDVAVAESLYALEPSHDETPERLYARRWAMTVLGRAIDTLRAEHAGSKKERVFEIIRKYLVPGSSSVPYAEAARALELSEVAVKVAVHRLRRKFRRILVDEIARTLVEGEDVDAEVERLMEALGS